MNRRGFLKGLGILTASSFIPVKRMKTVVFNWKKEIIKAKKRNPGLHPRYVIGETYQLREDLGMYKHFCENTKHEFKIISV